MSVDLPEPGADDFLLVLIDTLSEHPALEDWQFDDTTLWLIVLALLIRKGGVIIDLAETTGRKALFSNVVESTRAVSDSTRYRAEGLQITASIFGLDTRCVHLDSSVPPEAVRDLILDRRKRPLRAFSLDQAARAVSPGSTPTSPGVRGGGSGISTRYHSAESVLPASPFQSPLASPSMKVAAPVADKDWPDVLVVTGLEDCDSPTQNRLREMVKLSSQERADGREMLLVWIRREEESARVPAWLVSDHNKTVGCMLRVSTGRPVPRQRRSRRRGRPASSTSTPAMPHTHFGT